MSMGVRSTVHNLQLHLRPGVVYPLSSEAFMRLCHLLLTDQVVVRLANIGAPPCLTTPHDLLPALQAVAVVRGGPIALLTQLPATEPVSPLESWISCWRLEGSQPITRLE